MFFFGRIRRKGGGGTKSSLNSLVKTELIKVFLFLLVSILGTTLFKLPADFLSLFILEILGLFCALTLRVLFWLC